MLGKSICTLRKENLLLNYLINIFLTIFNFYGNIYYLFEVIYMSNIAIVTKSTLSGPLNVKRLYGNLSCDGYRHVHYLEITIWDNDINFIKKIMPSFNTNKDYYFPGDLVRYNSLDNSISMLDPYDNISDDELLELSNICNVYKNNFTTFKKLNNLPYNDMKLFFDRVKYHMRGCSVLKKKKSKYFR